MNVDFYDDDLPAPVRTWADSFRENKSTLILFSKYIGPLIGVSVVSLTAVKLIDKKMRTL